MKAVNSDTFVLGEDPFARKRCVYRSDKDRLCERLFGHVPLGMDADRQLPNIKVWKDGVSLEGDYPEGYKGPFTFTIEENDPADPKRPDVIMYEGKMYVIGEVHTVEDPYLEIDPEVIWVYPDWAVDNDVYSNTKWNVK